MIWERLFKLVRKPEREPERDCPHCANPDCAASRAVHDVFPISVSLEDLYDTSINLIEKIAAPPEICPGLWPIHHPAPAAPPPSRESARSRQALREVQAEAGRIERQLTDFTVRMESAEVVGQRLAHNLESIHRDLTAMTDGAEHDRTREADRRFFEDLLAQVEALRSKLIESTELDDLLGRIETVRAGSADRHQVELVETRLRELQAGAARRETVDDLAGRFELLLHETAGREELDRLSAQVEEVRRLGACRESVDALSAEIVLLRAARTEPGGGAGPAAAPWQSALDRLDARVELLAAGAEGDRSDQAAPDVAAIQSALDELGARLDGLQAGAAAPGAIEQIRSSLDELRNQTARRDSLDRVAAQVELLQAAAREKPAGSVAPEISTLSSALSDLSARLDLLQAGAAAPGAIEQIRSSIAELRNQTARREALDRLTARVELLDAAGVGAGVGSGAELSSLQSALDGLAARVDHLSAGAADRDTVDRLDAAVAGLSQSAARRRSVEALAGEMEMLRLSAAGRSDLESLASRVDQLRTASARRDAVDELAARLNDLEPKAATREALEEVAARLARGEAGQTERARELEQRLADLAARSAERPALEAALEQVARLEKQSAPRDQVRELAVKLEDLRRSAARGSDLDGLVQTLKELNASAARREDLDALARRVEGRNTADQQARDRISARLEQVNSAAVPADLAQVMLAQIEELRRSAATTEAVAEIQSAVRELRGRTEAAAADARRLEGRVAQGSEEQPAVTALALRLEEMERGFVQLQGLAEKGPAAPSAPAPPAVGPDVTVILERINKLESEHAELRRQIRKAFENLTAYPLKDLDEVKRRVGRLEQVRPSAFPSPGPAGGPGPRPVSPAALSRRTRNIAALVLVFILAGVVGVAIAGKYAGTEGGAARAGALAGSTAGAVRTEAEDYERPNTIYESAGSLLAPPILDFADERLKLKDGGITISGYAPGAVHAILYLNNEEAGEVEVLNEGFDFGRIELAYGVNVVEVKAVDAAGNETTSLARMIERMSAGAAQLLNSSGLNRMRGPRDLPQLALTIDAGSSNRRAELILDSLRERGIVTTLFLTGQFIEKYPDTVLRIVSDGHEVGDHTYSHPHLTTFELDRTHRTAAGMTKEKLQAELTKTRDLFRELTGQELAPWWRAPYGEYNDRILAWAEEVGFKHVDWTRTPDNLDMLDWVNNPGDRNYLDSRRLLSRLTAVGKGGAGRGNGSIILMHLGTDRERDFMDEVLPEAIDDLSGRGYRFVTISRMFEGQ